MASEFSGVSRIIEEHQGIITQFQGDAILAVFNLPVADPDHAMHAVTAGIKIRQYVRQHRFNHRQLGCRIGINSGELIAGNVGTDDRLHYTVHGDTVNIAARLDELNKEFGTTLLVTAATVAQLTNSGFGLRTIGATRVRGKSASVEVFELA